MWDSGRRGGHALPTVPMRPLGVLGNEDWSAEISRNLGVVPNTHRRGGGPEIRTIVFFLGSIKHSSSMIITPDIEGPLISGIWQCTRVLFSRSSTPIPFSPG